MRVGRAQRENAGHKLAGGNPDGGESMLVISRNIPARGHSACLGARVTGVRTKWLRGSQFAAVAAARDVYGRQSSGVRGSGARPGRVAR